MQQNKETLHVKKILHLGLKQKALQKPFLVLHGLFKNIFY